MGSIRLGVAVRQGAAIPDIGTEAGLAVFLRAAASIGLSDAAAGATSGPHVLGLLERLAVPPEAAGGPAARPSPAASPPSRLWPWALWLA